MKKFKLCTELKPSGDQPKAIEKLVTGLLNGKKHQLLVGVTGSGKTFTMANIIAQVNRPTLIIAPNKTLAAQLYTEMRELFPENSVEYFVSYYDYYQPEAYIPATDTYIAKDASINDEIDRMRHRATMSVLSRRDVIVVASVSCIYGLGDAKVYYGMAIKIKPGQTKDRDELLRELVEIQYERNDYDFFRGSFRVRGDIVDIFPVYETDSAIRVEFFDDIIERIVELDPVTGRPVEELPQAVIYPASHYVVPSITLKDAINSILEELRERIDELRKEGKILEAKRLEERTLYDIELLEQTGYCPGIENYSRHLTGRKPGEPPPTLVDYFPPDYIVIIDESHQTIPQLIGMYRGDRSRKETLVEYGFRLPSALDNRPLTFEEFNERLNQVIYVSATPGEYELNIAEQVVEQIIRPTGLAEPEIEVRPTKNQIEDLLGEIKSRVNKNERVLVTTLTKRLAEDITDYYRELGLKVQYLHSDIDTIERSDIISSLRRGEIDVIVGINLLREGLDLPEVSLVAILDADKEGFLRSKTSLIQISGRAARNINGKVIMYADKITKAMQEAIEETARRRRLQLEYNKKHGITPQGIKKAVYDLRPGAPSRDYLLVDLRFEVEEGSTKEELLKKIGELRELMIKAAQNLEFEKAAIYRDKIRSLEKRLQILN